MSEQLLECSLCGRDVDVRPPDGCGICHGSANVSPRAFTLSEVHAGKAPKEDRYGNDGGLNPSQSDLVVGGAINHPGLRQN
jgi:hypothetical protein